MSVRIPSSLRRLVDGQARVLVELHAGPMGEATVGEVLAALRPAHPGIHHAVLDERGMVRPHVNVFAGDENIRFGAGLATPLPEQAEVWILPAVSGGA